MKVQDILTCDGCSESFPLPVEHPAGSCAELSWEYTLNSLVNRVMDQDALPVVLALHYKLKPTFDSFFVPGLEIIAKGSTDVLAEFDFFFVRNQELFAGECKAGTELTEKDIRTAKVAADLGITEFSFCTVKRFSDRANELIAQLESELKEKPTKMQVKTLQGDELLGGTLP